MARTTRRILALPPLAAALLFAACAGKDLAPSGEVMLWASREDPDLLRVASSLSGLSLERSPPDRSWLNLLEEGSAGPGLILTEWGRDLASARRAGLVADLEPYRSRMRSLPYLWPGLMLSAAEAESFYPAALYCWGIFYNPSVLESAGLAFPKDWKAFVASLSKLEAKGVAPIALGSAAGWPALAWLSYIDIRMNGAAAHRRLLDGKRNIADPGGRKVCDQLSAWRERGYLVSPGPQNTWPESLVEVEEGRAAYVLMGSFAVSRFSMPASVRWAPLPSAGAKAGEIAVMQGFALSAKAAAPEAALALADAYVKSGSAGLIGDAFRVPAVAVDTRNKDAKAADSRTLSELKRSQEALLRTGAALVPQMDRYLPAQAAYDANQAMTAFFAPGWAMDAAALAAALPRIAR